MRRWNRRQVLKTGCAAAAIHALPASASAALPTPDDLLARVKKLTAPTDGLVLMLPDGCQSNVEPVARLFSAGTGVRLDVRVVPVNDVNTRLLIAHGRNERVDLALPATYGVPNLVEAGALRALDDIVPPDALAASQSLYQLGDTYNRHLYGLQTDGDVYVMFYNKRLLESPELAATYTEKFGMPPAPARTFDELDQLLRHFHEPAAGRYGGALFRTPGFLAWEWWIRFHAKGRWPFDANMVPHIDSNEGITALRDMVEATRFLHPETFTANLVENWKLFASGNVLCNIGWGGSQKFFRSSASGIKNDVLVAPTPGAKIDGSYIEFGHFNWGWNFAVPRTSRYPEIAALFSAFATHPEVSTLAVRAEDGFFDPFHSKHFDDPQIARVYGDNFLGVQRRMLESAIPDLYLAGKTRYLDMLDAHILRAVRNESRPTEALRAVSSLWNALTDELGRAGQIKQWRALRQRYPAALRRILK